MPGETPGYLDDAQLDRLAELLDAPTERGSLLVLHHPPLTVPALPYVESVVLQNIAALAEVVDGRDVRAILTGHLRFQLTGQLSSVPVWVTPGVVTRIDTSAPPRMVRAVLGAGATIVDLDGPSAPTFHVVSARDAHAGEEVYLCDPMTGQDLPSEDLVG